LDNTWKCSKSRSIGTQIQSRKELFTDVYSKRLEHTSIFCRDAYICAIWHFYKIPHLFDGLKFCKCLKGWQMAQITIWTSWRLL
jgi:hypothetical protein